MKKYITLIFASLLLLAFFSSSAFAMAARANPIIKARGMGEIEGAFFEITLLENLGMPEGILVFADYSNQKALVGEITMVGEVTPIKGKGGPKTGGSNLAITFSGSYTEDNINYTFEVTVEDLGTPGEGADTFSITLFDGYTKSGALTAGDIEIF